MSEAEKVNSPDHYTVGGIEVIDYLQSKLTPEQFKGFMLGNTLKYLSRAGYKGAAAVDLQKARWYLERLILEADNVGAAPEEGGPG